MKVYADTNIFTNLWIDLTHSEEAMSLIEELRRERAKLPITRLLRLEMTNALQRLVYESRHGTQGIRVSAETALAAHGNFNEELEAGEFLEKRAIADDVFESEFEALAYRYTANEGFRTYDIMHVAAALVLECDTFWSFDTRAKKLASLAGLRTNP
jgi:predicted nucleic acid-binding protein